MLGTPGNKQDTRPHIMEAIPGREPSNQFGADSPENLRHTTSPIVMSFDPTITSEGDNPGQYNPYSSYFPGPSNDPDTLNSPYTSYGPGSSDYYTYPSAESSGPKPAAEPAHSLEYTPSTEDTPGPYETSNYINKSDYKDSSDDLLEYSK